MTSLQTKKARLKDKKIGGDSFIRIGLSPTMTLFLVKLPYQFKRSYKIFTRKTKIFYNYYNMKPIFIKVFKLLI